MNTRTEYECGYVRTCVEPEYYIHIQWLYILRLSNQFIGTITIIITAKVTTMIKSTKGI